MSDKPAADVQSSAGYAAPEISIVTTMYRSRGYLQQFLADCIATLEKLACRSWEIVLVNDGSPDDSLDFALQCRGEIPGLVVVDLSRNFGHHNAVLAGLRHARGELVFLIDCDLEVPPSSLIDFHATLRRTGADIVFGYQEARKGGAIERAGGGLFWKVFNALSDTKIHESVLTERLMTRRFVESLLQLGDHNLFLAAMMSWAGFNQVGLPVKKKQREGRSTYTLAKRLQLVVNAVSSFSSKPLLWLFNAGIGITIISFLYAAYLVVRRILFDDTLLGFTAVMTMMAMSLGILTTAIGIVGVYLGKIFNQVQNRPIYIVKDIHR